MWNSSRRNYQLNMILMRRITMKIIIISRVKIGTNYVLSSQDINISLEKIEQLLSIIEQYGTGQKIEMYLTNLHFQLQEENLRQHFQSTFPTPKHNCYLNMQWGEKRGSAIISTASKELAKHCALQTTELLMGRKVYMEIEPLDNSDGYNIIKKEMLNASIENQSQLQQINQVQSKQDLTFNEAINKMEECKISEKIQEKKPIGIANQKLEENKLEENKLEVKKPSDIKVENDGDEWGAIGQGKKKTVMKVVVHTKSQQSTLANAAAKQEPAPAKKVENNQIQKKQGKDSTITQKKYVPKN